MSKMFVSFYCRQKMKMKTDSGLTLIECLVAITIIALTSASIAPVLVLSVATRVQNQKAEQALHIAQGEVDRIRLLVERNPTYTSDQLMLAESDTAPLDPAPSATLTDVGTAITTVEPPTSLASEATWTASGYAPTDVVAREIDTDEDGIPNFVLQSFRGGAVTPIGLPNMPVVFDMGVRVYDYRAVTNAAGDLKSGLDRDAALVGFTSGEGQRASKPLAVLYTQIINSDNPQSLCAYMDYLREENSPVMSCN